jgi:dTMP kinase
MKKVAKKTTKKKQGKFIVIEGTDGSGKGTQVLKLVERLRKEGKQVEIADFPQHGQPSGFFVSKYLRGEYGSGEDVGPYRGSLFYALDRYDKSFDIKRWLKEGKYVIANRYVSANMGHQAGKIDNLKKRDEYLSWLHDLEYGIFDLPKPDQTIFLFVPPEIGQTLVDKKKAREYTKGKKRDIHENDLKHLQKASKAYFYVAKKYGWTTIDCTRKGEMLSREEIHDVIYSHIS